MAKKKKLQFFNPIHLTKENEINKLIRSQKKTGQKTYVLFTSQWDDHCTNILKAIERKCKSKTLPSSIPLFVINSFDAPHSFVIYDVKKAPTLVILDGNDVFKEEYTPNIWHKLGV